MSEKAERKTLDSQPYPVSSAPDRINFSALELATVMKASQAFFSEIIGEKILQDFFKIVLKNTWSQKGCLILEQDKKLAIEAWGCIERDEVTLVKSLPIDTSKELPLSAVNYVAKTQEDVVLSDAASE